jgi:hypothetical protein
MIFGEIAVPGAIDVSVILLVTAFGWCWRQRCLRRSIKEIEQQRHEQRMELLREYGKLLSDARLTADDLPLIAHLERIEPEEENDPPDEIEPPAAS